MKNFIIIMFLLVVSIIDVICEEIPGSSILNKMETSITEKNDFLAFLNLTSITENNKRVKEKLIFFSDQEKGCFLLLFVHPEKNEGFSYIKNGNKIWGTGPSIGAHFSFKGRELIGPHYITLDDFNIKNYSSDYNVINIEKSILKRHEVHIIQLKAKDNKKPQKFIKLWVQSEKFLPLKEKILDREKKPIKTILYSRWQKIGSGHLPTHMLFLNETENKIKTEVIIKQIIVSRLPEYIFTRSFIEFMLK